MEYFIVGIAVAFNVLVILWKLQQGRKADGVLDAAILIGITVIFSGSYGALVVGTVASAVVSVYLLVNKPKFDFDISGSKFDEYKY